MIDSDFEDNKQGIPMIATSLPTSLAPSFQRSSPYARVFFVILLMAGWTLLGCQVMVDGLCPFDHPADDALIAKWQNNRADFDQLITMFVADQDLDKVGDNWMEPDSLADAGID